MTPARKRRRLRKIGRYRDSDSEPEECGLDVGELQPEDDLPSRPMAQPYGYTAQEEARHCDAHAGSGTKPDSDDLGLVIGLPCPPKPAGTCFEVSIQIKRTCLRINNTPISRLSNRTEFPKCYLWGERYRNRVVLLDGTEFVRDDAPGSLWSVHVLSHASEKPDWGLSPLQIRPVLRLLRAKCEYSVLTNGEARILHACYELSGELCTEIAPEASRACFSNLQELGELKSGTPAESFSTRRMYKELRTQRKYVRRFTRQLEEQAAEQAEAAEELNETLQLVAEDMQEVFGEVDGDEALGQHDEVWDTDTMRQLAVAPGHGHRLSLWLDSSGYNISEADGTVVKAEAHE